MRAFGAPAGTDPQIVMMKLRDIANPRGNRLFLATLTIGAALVHVFDVYPNQGILWLDLVGYVLASLVLGTLGFVGVITAFLWVYMEE